MKKSSGWYYTLYRIQKFLSVLHLDDLEWSRSRETKNSYHKWIHMATTNEVHCSTFNFLLISEKSYFRIFPKKRFLDKPHHKQTTPKLSAKVGGQWLKWTVQNDPNGPLTWRSERIIPGPFRFMRRIELDGFLNIKWAAIKRLCGIV